MLALACAHLGDERAVPLIERVRDFDRVEARAVEALLFCRQGRHEAAAAQVEKVFLSLRDHPWCLSHVLETVFPVALEVAVHRPEDAARLYDAMGQPFSVYVHEEDRLAAAHALAGLIGPRAMLQTLEAYEPYVPWNERFLEDRWRVYQAADHPFAAQAHRDLMEFRNSSKHPKSLIR